MTKPEWGLKRKCLKCGTCFYDLHKKTFSCPKCKEKYTPDSYEENKTKQLLKLARKAAPKIDNEDLDEESLLQMTEDIPLSDEDLGSDELEILEEDDTDLTENEHSELTGIVDHFEDEETNEK